MSWHGSRVRGLTWTTAAAIVTAVMYTRSASVRAWGTSGGIVRAQGGGTSCGSTWSDSGLRGSICLFDKKSSVRKENKQPGVLLPWSQRKSSYSSTTQYLQCRSDAHSHTHARARAHSAAHVPARVCRGVCTEGRCWGEGHFSGTIDVIIRLLRTADVREHLRELAGFVWIKRRARGPATSWPRAPPYDCDWAIASGLLLISSQGL